MQITHLIKRIPLVRHLHERYITFAWNRANADVLRQLESAPNGQGAQIAQALNSLRQALSQPEQDWIQRIEYERKQLAGRKDPLVDGSLGAGGLFDEKITVGQTCLVSKPPQQALLLFLLIRAIKPLNVIELGTNVGISSAYIAAALKLNGQGGKITTLDASRYRQRLAKDIHGNLHLDNISYIQGLFADTLSPVLREAGSVDFAFIDGDHHYRPTLDYFEVILARSAPGAVLVLDDIRWSYGMKKAWSHIQADARLGLAVDLSSLGICITLNKAFVSVLLQPPPLVAEAKRGGSGGI